MLRGRAPAHGPSPPLEHPPCAPIVAIAIVTLPAFGGGRDPLFGGARLGTP
jgi:hypothetical protein